jgi:Uma2 family endonuclease
METEAEVNFALEELPMPLTLRPKVPMSEDHLLRFCSANRGYQIEMEPDGSLSIDQPKGARYSRAIVILSSEVYGWAEKDGRGITFPDVGVYLPDGSMRSPGVAWLSLEKWQGIPKDDRDSFLRVLPEFVAEIRCHTDTDEGLALRMKRWIDAGAQLAWLIDPLRKLAIIYHPGPEPETLLQPELLNGEGPIAGFTLKMQRLWE